MTGKKLLVADDSLTIQKVIRLALSNEGYEIHAVSDGNDAVQQISLFRPDIVLIDVSLPGKSAFEVKRAINEHVDLEDVRFVLMSSAFESVDEGQAAEVNFHGRLTKPFDPAHLREVLQQVMSQVMAKKMEPTSILNLGAHVGDLGEPSDLPLEEPDPSVLEAASEYPSSAPDGDIRQLTESTIRMSGLDDFQWSVQETSLRTPPNPAEDEPLLPPPPRGTGGAGSAAGKPREISLDEISPPIPPIPSMQQSAASPQLSLSSQEMEEIIRREVEASLERFARKILPEMAEKVIKQEIHRLLSEQP